jgi:GDP-L-fucose synthase
MNKNSRILVAGGHRGHLGTAIVRKLKSLGYKNIMSPSPEVLDFRNKLTVDSWFDQHRPEYVFQVAAKLIGLLSQDWGETILYNLEIQNNLFDAARRYECKKLLFTGSSCAYPKFSKNPITEDQLLSGGLEPTSEAYSVAKIAGIKMAEFFRRQWGCNFITVMPGNLFGPNDTFDDVKSHVMSDFISKFVRAQHYNQDTVTLWGDGQQVRDFMFVDDAADACVFCMLQYNDSQPINISAGQPVDLMFTANQVKDITKFKGNIVWDLEKPMATPVKILDNSKLKNLGWTPQISLKQGIEVTVNWYKKNCLT